MTPYRNCGRYGDNFGFETACVVLTAGGGFSILTAIGAGFGAITDHFKEGLTYGLVSGGAIAAVAIGVGLWEYKDYKKQKKEDAAESNESGRRILHRKDLGSMAD